jgi:hypothetical protein
MTLITHIMNSSRLLIYVGLCCNWIYGNIFIYCNPSVGRLMGVRFETDKICILWDGNSVVL